MASEGPVADGVIGERWELDGPGGRERWCREGGRFAAVTVGTKRLVVAERPFDGDQLGMRESRCAHRGPWPNAFGFCPECGVALGTPDGSAAGEDWSFVSGGAGGLPVVGRGLRPVPDSRREEAMPAAASAHLVVAGRPSHLFAFDGRSGWLRARREADRDWVELRRLAVADLPRWSWAAAVVAGGAGFVLPTAEGPVSVRCGADAELAVSAGGEAVGGAACVGGAAALRNGAAVVPVRGAGGLGMAVLDGWSGGNWRLVALPAGEAAAGTAELFAAPVAQDDDVFWCGRDGILTVSARDGEVVAAYRRWDAGTVPVRGTRPLRAPDGRLYQLCRSGKEALAFVELCLPGRSGERRPASSLWMSGGEAAFIDGRRRRLPWDEGRGRGEWPLRDGDFLLPILGFDERRFLLASCPGRATLGRFLDVEQDGERGDEDAVRNCQLMFTAATRSLEALQGGVEARKPSDLAGFVFRRRLFVHAALSNRCWSWELEAVEAG